MFRSQKLFDFGDSYINDLACYFHYNQIHVARPGDMYFYKIKIN